MNISSALLAGLEREHGDSFYLLDLARFEENCTRFLEAFRSIYPKTNIAYSYKTNYIPQLCAYVHSIGGLAEVVSAMEYDLAIRIGVPPHKIVFNGPYKPERDIERALTAGATVNLDSPYEVALIKRLSERLSGRMITVGIRCNIDIGTAEVSRFGFDAEGDDLKSVFETLRRLVNCRIAGLHCHVCTATKSVEAYDILAERMIELSAALFQERPPLFLNLGGGFFSNMSSELRQQFPHHVPTYEEYAGVIASRFARAFPDDSGPELILEPGMAITADIMKFAAKAIDIKRVRSRRVVLVSGSVYNTKPTLNEKDLPIEVYHPDSALPAKNQQEIFDIVGYTCMEHDVLFKRFEGSLAPGDYVVFNNVGAYTIVLKPPFIIPCPPILAYNSRLGKFEVIKRREESSDVFSTFLPPHDFVGRSGEP